MGQPSGNPTGRQRRSFARESAFVVLVLVAAVRGEGEEPAGGSDTERGMAMRLRNPVADMISVSLENDMEWGIGSNSKGFRYTLNLQPVIPVALSDDWNLIVQTVLPIVHQTDVVPGKTQSGMGDVQQSAYLTPEYLDADDITWGIGPTFLFPTATSDSIDEQQFALGPAAVVLRQDDVWTVGVLANHLVSASDTKNRNSINQTLVQPFLSYTTSSETTFAIDMEAEYDWQDSKWTVPVNLSVAQMLHVWEQAMQFQLGPRLYAGGPSDVPDWGISVTYVLLFPE